MHISGIFEKIEDKLFAVRIENIGEEELAAKDELDKLLDKWKDVEWLARFFTAFRKDLLKFEPTMRVKDAIKQTIREAEKIYDHLIEISENDKLDDLFRPLDNREESQPPYEFQKLKAKGVSRKSMLRLYAVKFRDWYIISGGAIKLTDQMDSRPHLKTELHKLTLVKKFLQEDEDAGSFVYLDIQ